MGNNKKWNYKIKTARGYEKNHKVKRRKDMKKIMVCFLALVLAIGLSTTSVFACSAVYVGKDVSTDGSTIVARSEDQGTGAYNKMFVVVPHIENVEGRFLTDVQGFKYPLPATTYKYTMIPDASGYGDGVYAGASTNEYGLSISATVSASPKEAVEKVDPFVEGGLREAALTELIAATCKTPKEGVQRLAEVIEKYGSEEGNIIFLANKEEAWLFEVYSGHLWAAQKMPTDKVAMFGNQFMIETPDPADKDNFMYQKDLFTKADANNWAVKVNGRTHLAATFGEPREDYSNMRTWMGHKIMAPSSIGEYKTADMYPLFYSPDKKVSPLDVMDILRSRFEGTNLDASLPQNKDLRVIGVERQSQIHVIQIKDKYPTEMGALQWLAFGNAEHSVFLPNFSGITDTYHAYKVDGDRYNPNGAYWKYKRICALAEQNRPFYGQGVKNYWKFWENMLYAQMQQEEDKVIDLYKKDPEKAAEYVTGMHMQIAEQFANRADHLYSNLLFFVMDRNGRTAAKMGGPFVAEIGLRDAAVAKGYALSWQGNAKPIVVTKGDTSYSFEIGKDTCNLTKSGRTTQVKLDFAPLTDDGTIYIPFSIAAQF